MTMIVAMSVVWIVEILAVAIILYDEGYLESAFKSFLQFRSNFGIFLNPETFFLDKDLLI